MRGETHYEGGTHIVSWALGREIPRRRRGWAPRRGSPCASLFAAALAVSEELSSPTWGGWEARSADAAGAARSAAAGAARSAAAGVARSAAAAAREYIRTAAPADTEILSTGAAGFKRKS